jgi:DNA-binding NarL/FixJ family response regulator
MSRILIADDHAVMRKGLRALIDSEPTWEICGEATDGREAVELAKATNPDLAVIDISMPALNGFQATAEIVKAGLGTRILLFSTHDSPHFIAEAERLGAHGYVSKASGEQQLIQAIASLLRGDCFFYSAGACQKRDTPLNK